MIPDESEALNVFFSDLESDSNGCGRIAALCEALFAATRIGDSHSVRSLIDALLRYSNKPGAISALNEALCYAAISGNLEMIKLLVDAYAMHLSGSDQTDVPRGALVIAAQLGYSDIVQCLLEACIEHDQSPTIVHTLKAALDQATNSEQFEIVRMLLNAFKHPAEDSGLVPGSRGILSKIARWGDANGDGVTGDLTDILLYAVKAKDTEAFSSLLDILLDHVVTANCHCAKLKEVVSIADVEVFRTLSRTTQLRTLNLLRASTPVTESISDSLKNATPTDFVLSTKNRQFMVHKDVLTFWSDYFAKLFCSNWRDSEYHGLELFSHQDVQMVVDFVYRGFYAGNGVANMALEPERAHEIADYLQIQAMKDQAKQAISN